MDSAGGLNRFGGPARPREIIAAAKAAGCGVMGIRAVQAGALTLAIDHAVSPNNPDATDYERAAAVPRALRSWGEDPAYVAHRYALGIDGVDTLVLGVKNRAELASNASPPKPPARWSRTGSPPSTRWDCAPKTAGCSCTCRPGPRSRPFSRAPGPSSFRSAPTSSTGRPASWAPTGCARRSSPTRRRSDGADLLVAPTFNIGMAQHHLDFPGTIALRPSTFMAAIGDWVRSLAHHGFDEAVLPQRPRRQRRHHRGGVLRALRRGELRRPAGRLRPEAAQLVGPAGRRVSSPASSSPPATAATRRPRRSPSPSGPIPTPSRPPTTPRRSPPPARSARSSDFRKRHPDGRMGSDPGLATPEKGGELVKLAATGLIEEVAAFGAEPAP